MSFFNSLKGKKVAFIGAGVAHKTLIEMFANAGAKVTLCDQKSLPDFGDYGANLQRMGVTLSLGENYLGGLLGQDIIMRTPGFLYYHPALQAAAAAGARITSETELFFEHCPAKKVLVTGSDGKTTTTTLIAQMYTTAGFTTHLGGNIGKALLPIVDEIKPRDIVVAELSSFQLISMKPQADTAVITNITPNHLNWHKDMQEYTNAKHNILLNQTQNSLTVLGYDNAITRGMQKDTHGECRMFSRREKMLNGAFLDDDGMLCLINNKEKTPVVHSDELLLPGKHNIENMLAAFAAVCGDMEIASMQKVARGFNGVAHRIEPVRELDGVKWYNDSISTSPTRLMAGLRSFDQPIVLIAGGYDKNLPYAPAVPDILARVKTLILTGPAGPIIEKAVRSDSAFKNSGLVMLHAKDMPQAVQAAAQNACSGNVVLLSPACAAYDAYPTFEERGNHFKDLVNAL